MQQLVASHGKGVPFHGNERPIGQIVDAASMTTLGAAVEPFGVQPLVHIRGAWARLQAERLPPALGKSLRIRAPAFETRPVAGGEGSSFIQEKEARKPATPNIAMSSLKFQQATNPLPR